MAEVHDPLHHDLFGEVAPQRLAVAGTQPLVADDVRQPAAAAQHLAAAMVEVDVQVGRRIVHRRMGRGQVALGRADLLLPHVRRVADHGVEAAVRGPVAAGQVDEDLGELQVPVEEALPLPQVAGAGDGLPIALVHDDLPAQRRQHVRAVHGHELDGVRPPGPSPSSRRDASRSFVKPLAHPQVERLFVGKKLALERGVGLGAPLHVGQGGVGALGHLDHHRGQVEQPGERPLEQRELARVRHLHRPFHRAHVRADHRVAPAQVVIQEAERRADREGVQPQAQLRQLHRQRVEVHAVDAALHHQAGQQCGVVQPGRIDRDALPRHLRQDLPPHALDQPLHGVPVPGHVRMRVVVDLHPPDDAVGQVIHRVDQKMAAAHRAVADFDPQERFERVPFGLRR